MIGFEQHNPHHDYDVWEHTLMCMAPVYDATYTKSPDLITRLAIFFHDIGKPCCYTVDKNGIGHFYGHAKISAEITRNILMRLRFSNEIIESVTQLIANHDAQFEPKPSVIKRMLNKFGAPQLFRLIDLRLCDILGQKFTTQLDKANNINMFKTLVEHVLEEENCFQLKDLAVNGNDLIDLGIQKGPVIGEILEFLLNSVIDEKIENNKEELILLAKEFYFDNRN